MSLNLFRWLFVLAVLIHNTEEAMFLPAWSKTAGRWHAPVSASQFRFAVTILSFLLVVIALFASIEPPRSVASYLMSGYVLAMLVNVLFPHLLATLFMRRYMPGTATALLLNLPVGIAYLHKALTTETIEFWTFMWSGLLVILSLLGAIPLLFSIWRLGGISREAK